MVSAAERLSQYGFLEIMNAHPGAALTWYAGHDVLKVGMTRFSCS